MPQKRLATGGESCLQDSYLFFKQKDARVYHYFAVKSREECLKEKSRRFVNSYFSGNGANAFATLLRSVALTEEQIRELEGILEQSREKTQEGRDNIDP